MVLRPVPGGSTVDAVLEQLQDQVSGGSWPVGGRIPAELDLAAQLGVSRPAVREAIRALSHVGVLEVRRGDGTYVRSSANPRPLLRRVARATARDVFEVQLAYDVQAARLAARRRTDADLAHLEELLRARDEATEADEFGAADARFHLGVAEATRNPVLIEAMRFFIDRLHESMRTIRLDHEVPEAGPAAHRAVLDAIAAGDPSAAGEAAAAVVEPTLAILETLVDHDRTAHDSADRATPGGRKPTDGESPEQVTAGRPSPGKIPTEAEPRSARQPTPPPPRTATSQATPSNRTTTVPVAPSAQTPAESSTLDVAAGDRDVHGGHPHEAATRASAGSAGRPISTADECGPARDGGVEGR